MMALCVWSLDGVAAHIPAEGLTAHVTGDQCDEASSQMRIVTSPHRCGLESDVVPPVQSASATHGRDWHVRDESN